MSISSKYYLDIDGTSIEQHDHHGSISRQHPNQHLTLNIMSNYPLYDIPCLVREPNDTYMSLARHRIEVRNQAIVDDYFIERDKGTSAGWAQKLVARKRGIPIMRVEYCLRWYYQEAVRRKKYDFLIKFPPAKEHIVQFERIFAPGIEKTQPL